MDETLLARYSLSKITEIMKQREIQQAFLINDFVYSIFNIAFSFIMLSSIIIIKDSPNRDRSRKTKEVVSVKNGRKNANTKSENKYNSRLCGHLINSNTKECMNMDLTMENNRQQQNSYSKVKSNGSKESSIPDIKNCDKCDFEPTIKQSNTEKVFSKTKSLGQCILKHEESDSSFLSNEIRDASEGAGEYLNHNNIEDGCKDKQLKHNINESDQNNKNCNTSHGCKNILLDSDQTCISLSFTDENLKIVSDKLEESYSRLFDKLKRLSEEGTQALVLRKHFSLKKGFFRVLFCLIFLIISNFLKFTFFLVETVRVTDKIFYDFCTSDEIASLSNPRYLSTIKIVIFHAKASYFFSARLLVALSAVLPICVCLFLLDKRSIFIRSLKKKCKTFYIARFDQKFILLQSLISWITILLFPLATFLCFNIFVLYSNYFAYFGLILILSALYGLSVFSFNDIFALD